MSIEVTVPTQGTIVAQPFTVIVIWTLPADTEEILKRYQDKKKSDASTALPFIAQLSVEGVNEWYQWHHDATEPTIHRFEGIHGEVGSRRLYVELLDTTTNPFTKLADNTRDVVIA